MFIVKSIKFTTDLLAGMERKRLVTEQEVMKIIILSKEGQTDEALDIK